MADSCEEELASPAYRRLVQTAGTRDAGVKVAFGSMEEDFLYAGLVVPLV